MSDTPRTDAIETAMTKASQAGQRRGFYDEFAAFARELERELAEARNSMDYVRQYFEHMRYPHPATGDFHVTPSRWAQVIKMLTWDKQNSQDGK